MRKIQLRRLLLERLGISRPRVLETHGGRGEIWKTLYSGCQGAVIELDPEKAEFLSRQRPAWPVYEGRAEEYLEAGLFRWLEFQFFDCDPFGEPWPALEGFFGSDRKLAPRMAIAVNDGLRQNARVKGAWKVGSTKAAARRYGNDKVRDHYLDICQEKVEEIAASAGYQVEFFDGYYCGNLDDMTHYGAVLVRP
jgi:hypothetical protein